MDKQYWWTIYDEIAYEECKKKLDESISEQLEYNLTGKNPFKKKIQPYELPPMGAIR